MKLNLLTLGERYVRLRYNVCEVSWRHKSKGNGGETRRREIALHVFDIPLDNGEWINIWKKGRGEREHIC